MSCRRCDPAAGAGKGRGRPSRRLAWFALLVLALLFFAPAGGPLAFPDEPPESPEARKKRIDEERKAKEAADREFATRVNEAIRKGHAYLKEGQNADGSWNFAMVDRQLHGRIALVLLTLAKCGSGRDDPEIQKGLKTLLPIYEQRKAGGEWMTYSTAVTLLFFDALYNPPVMKDGNFAAPSKKKCKYPKDIEDKIKEMVRWIVDKQETQVWRYPGAGGDAMKEDLSNTQLALLALQAAGRCGIDAPATTYRKTLEYLLRTQEETGPDEHLWIPNPAWEPGSEDRYGPFLAAGKAKARGWRYLEKAELSGVTGSMTTAGVACLAIVKERLQALDDLDKETSKKIDRAMTDGLAWLGRHFAVDKNPNQGMWHYYYLYGLERVGAFTGQDHIGRHDWYREGADYLLKSQDADGSWPGAGEHEERLLQTCFALLFLKRVTVRPAKPLGPVITEGN